MTRDLITDKITSILRKITGDDDIEITPETSLRNGLMLDSLDGVEFIMEVEKGFQIAVSEDDYQRIRSVGDAVEVVDRILNGKK